MKLPGVISLRNDLPTCAMPNGSFLRIDCWTLSKFTKIPRALHVVLELDTERPELPRRARAAVDLARREHESSPFGEGDDLVEQLRRWRFGHVVAGAGCGSRASSSRRRDAWMSRSSTYCRNERRCRSSSAASGASTRRSHAPSEVLTNKQPSA